MSDQRMKRFAAAQHEKLAKAMNLVSGAMNLSAEGREKRGMAVPSVFSRFPHIRPDLEAGINAFTILLMVDLSPFSSIVQTWDAQQIQKFLERYYSIVVGCVIEANGVVEKFIGDAVLAAFGAPFEPSSTKERLNDVIGVAGIIADLIMEEFNGEVTAKSSITCGDCFFGYAGPPAHRELTIIGTPLTELFRLEDKCPIQSVIIPSAYFKQAAETWQIKSYWEWQLQGQKPRWDIGSDTLDLRGVGSTPVTYLKRINYNGR